MDLESDVRMQSPVFVVLADADGSSDGEAEGDPDGDAEPDGDADPDGDSESDGDGSGLDLQPYSIENIIKTNKIKANNFFITYQILQK